MPYKQKFKLKQISWTRTYLYDFFCAFNKDELNNK